MYPPYLKKFKKESFSTLDRLENAQPQLEEFLPYETCSLFYEEQRILSHKHDSDNPIAKVRFNEHSQMTRRSLT